jgi:hypothetical protein
MRVLQRWQGRGKLFASGSVVLTVGYYCQEMETNPPHLLSPLLETNGTITSDEAHTLITWYRGRTQLTLETDEFSLPVCLIDPYHFRATAAPTLKPAFALETLVNQ